MNELEQIKTWYAEGLSLLAIGKRLGHSQQYPYLRLKKAGVKLRPLRGSGPQHSQWVGGRIADGQGYMKVWIAPDDPLAAMRLRAGYVKEHRLVMARSLGRALLPTETVHHINGDKTDNRLENLQLRQGKHGKGVVMCCAECGSRNLRPVELDS